MTLINRQNTNKMTPQRRREVRAICLKAMKQLSQCSVGDRPDLASLHPYNAKKAAHSNPLKRKNYLAEAITNGYAGFDKPYILCKADGILREIIKAPKFYRLYLFNYFSDKERKEAKVKINKKGLLVKSGQPISGDFIYCADRNADLYLSPRVKKIYFMDHEKNNRTKYPTADMAHHSSISAGKAVMCAGYVTALAGKILHIDNRSGHYRPRLEHLCNFFNRSNITKAFNSNTIIECREKNQKPVQYNLEELDRARWEVAKKWPNNFCELTPALPPEHSPAPFLTPLR